MSGERRAKLLRVLRVELYTITLNQALSSNIFLKLYFLDILHLVFVSVIFLLEHSFRTLSFTALMVMPSLLVE